MRPTSRKIDSRLNVAKVMEDFQKAEESSSRRKGTFRIAAPFEQALKAILKAKPGKTKV
ncbi:MAG: hypothetical protein ABSE93_00240 [Terriglobia bacterium]|jgi:hypothetical protein